MADNITEADQLIIQLLAALNSTIGSYTASQESDNSDATANQLALTALVVSLIALVVALLQAVLQYVSSNSAQGDKCNTGAIGEYARVSGTRKWSWRHWRRQYFYPELTLGLMDVRANIHDVETSEVGNVFKGFKKLNPGQLDNYKSVGNYSWRYDRELEGPIYLNMNTIQNGRHLLSRRVEAGWELVWPEDLPMKYRLKWFRYLVFRRHRQGNTPRATWAQLLTLLNVDARRVDTSRLVGADCIPSILDVPAQKVKLTDLGMFAFCLGFNQVEISIQDRTILATGEVGTITTESLPGFGAVVRFQILSPQPQHFVPVYDPELAMVHHQDQLLGSFIFGSNLSRGMCPMRYDLLRGHLDLGRTAQNARCSTTNDEAKDWLGVAETFQERESSKASATWETDLFLEYLKTWQVRQNDENAGGVRRWPTVLLAASIACLPATTTGFPSSAFLRPFLQVFQHMARSLSSTACAIWDNLDDLGEETMILQLLQADFCRIAGHDDLVDQCRIGNFSWMYNELDLDGLGRVEKILLSKRPLYNYYRYSVWILGLRQPVFRKSRVVIKSHPGDDSSSVLEGRLLPHIVELLKSFDPVSWATAVRSQSHLKREPGQGKGGWRDCVQPENVLWAQVYFLDLAISKILCQNVQLMLNVPKAVGKVLVECWEDPKADAPLQCLDKFLSQKLFSDRGTQGQVEQMRALADMIKVRMLCYIAYMMVIPDSTSLYEASLQGPVMVPMI